MTFWPVLRTFKKDLNFTSRDSKELMAKGAFNLCKWNWNSSELLQLIKNKKESIARTKTEKTNAVVEEEDESFIKFSVGPTRTADTLVKTLGVCWNTATDEISFDSADWVCKHENNMRIIIEHILTMSLLRKFSKVVKSFLGHNTSSLQNPPFFSNFSLFLNIWSTYHRYRKYHWPLWPVKHIKENGGLSEIKTRRSKEHFCVSNGRISSFLVFLENTSLHIEKAPC